MPSEATQPVVRLVRAFDRSFENAVATARTCYSDRGLVTEDQVSGTRLSDPALRLARETRRDALARSIYEAGHHTTLQHGHFQFALEGVSRHFLWSFLHSHPFYNSEQVSQRYVEVKPEGFYRPPLPPAAFAIYERTVAAQMSAYRELSEVLLAPVRDAYLARFPGRRTLLPKYGTDIVRRAREIARYVLPVACLAYLYHTVSGLTILRYHRISGQLDVPFETRAVIGRMVAEMLRHDPLWRTLLEEPLPLDATPEWAFLAAARGGSPAAREFAAEFDSGLQGRVAVLAEGAAGNEAVLASAVREVLGLPRARLSDGDAIDLVLDPERNRLLGETLNLATHSKLLRTLVHARYTFRKKLSHTADSQDQRHRMTPASRPVLAAQVVGPEDCIVPGIVSADDRIRRIYVAALEEGFRGAEEIRGTGAGAEFAEYLLPNAVAIRFTESADLLNLRHKLAMRLCWNAQEEIWRASLDEWEAIRRLDPRIGRHLGPPCSLRHAAGVRPICPEGPRYCGVPVWTLDAAMWRRTI